MSRTGRECLNCGEDATAGTSLPVGDNGDIVAIDYKGSWAGVPACATCVELHRVAGSNGPAVLDVYEKAVRNRREDLETILKAMRDTRELFEGLPL